MDKTTFKQKVLSHKHGYQLLEAYDNGYISKRELLIKLDDEVQGKKRKEWLDLHQKINKKSPIELKGTPKKKARKRTGKRQIRYIDSSFEDYLDQKKNPLKPFSEKDVERIRKQWIRNQLRRKPAPKKEPPKPAVVAKHCEVKPAPQNISWEQKQRYLWKEVNWGIYLKVLPVIALFILGLIFVINPGMTGFTVVTEEYSYQDPLNLVLNQTTEYIWLVQNPSEIRSISLSGSIPLDSEVKITLHENNTEYIVLDTGYLIDHAISRSSVNLSEMVISYNTSEQTSGLNKSIVAKLEYDPGSSYDIDNNGFESTSGIIDFTVEDSEFSWDVDKDKLCTHWIVKSMDTADITKLCYGDHECCNFIDLQPSKESWDEPFLLNHGSYGATYKNIVSSQIIYFDYNLTVDNLYFEVLHSAFAHLSAGFHPEMIYFEDACVETCTLKNFNKSKYLLKIDIRNTTLALDSVAYTSVQEIPNRPPKWDVIPDQKIDPGQQLVLNLTDYISEPDNDNLIISCHNAENLSVILSDYSAAIVPDEGFSGKQYIFFSANDSELVSVSNTFEVNVAKKQVFNRTETVKQGIAVIGRPVKWQKKVRLNATASNVTLNISDEALNFTARRIKQGMEEKIGEDKITVIHKGVQKEYDEYLTDKKLEIIDDEVTELLAEKRENVLNKKQLKEINTKLIAHKNQKNHLTGYAISAESKGWFIRFFEWLFGAKIEFGKPPETRKLSKNARGFSLITGMFGAEAVPAVNETNVTEIVIGDEVDEVEVEYYTEGPYSAEENVTNRSKLIKIISDIHYENVLAYTDIGLPVPESGIWLYWEVNGTRKQVDFEPYDRDNDGHVDYIEWIVPHLSNQSYLLIIEITTAYHLDQDKVFVSDIYREVREKDNSWSEKILPDEYVRVSFEENLTSANDITIYARSNATSRIHVYTKDGASLLASFLNITSEAWHKVYLAGLNSTNDAFDLKILDSAVEFDYIVDPTIYNESNNTVYQCGNLTDPDVVYTLNQSINTTETCIRIQANNVTLDLNGFNITGDSNSVDDYGVYVKGYNRSTIKNGEIYGFGRAVSLTRAYNSTISNLSFSSVGNFGFLSTIYGLHLDYSFYANITGCEVNSMESTFSGMAYGLYLSNSDNNTISRTATNLSAISSDYGIYLSYSDNNSMKSLNVRRSGGLYMERSNKNDFHDINFTSNRLYIYYGSNNAFDEISQWNCTSQCIYLYSKSQYNRFSTMFLNYSEDSANGIHLYSDGLASPISHNIFEDINVTAMSGDDIHLQKDADLGGVALNNTFVNVSYSGTDAFSGAGDGAMQLTRKWYYNAYVEDTNSIAVDQAGIYIYNVSIKNQVNLTTGGDGLTETAQLTDYINTDGTKDHYSNYTMNATASGYDTVTHSYNLSLEHNIEDEFTLTLLPDTGPPSLEFINDTPVNATLQRQDWLEVNVSIAENDLKEAKFNWNGTNCTLYNDSLVLFMNLNNLTALGENSTHIADLSRQQNNGTYVNNRSIGSGIDIGASGFNRSAGKYQGSFEFDGDWDYINLGQDVFSAAQLEKATISLWAKPYSLAPTCVSDSCPQLVYLEGRMILYQDEDDTFYSYIWDGEEKVINSKTTIEKDTWYHIAVTWDGTDHILYINGNQEDSIAAGSPDLDAVSNNVAIGARHYLTYGFFNGTIDEVRIWNISLSADEIQQLYFSNLYKHNSSQWYIIANQSKNSTIGLVEGTYTYQAYAYDSADNLNESKQRTIYVDYSAPTWDEYPANAQLEYTVDHLNVDFNASDMLYVSSYFINDTVRFNMSIEGILGNATLLDQGVYYINVSVNDTLDQVNSTDININVSSNSDYPQFSGYAVNDSLLGADDYAKFSVSITDASETIGYANATIGGVSYELTDGAGDAWYYDWQCISSDADVGFTHTGASDTGYPVRYNYTDVTGISTECDADLPAIGSEAKSPSTVHNDDHTQLNATITDSNLDQVWIAGNWSSSWENLTPENEDDIYYFNVSSANYTNQQVVGWRYYANDTANNLQEGALQTFKIENRLPANVSLIEPPNATITADNTTFFNWTNASDEDMDYFTFKLQIDNDKDFSSPEFEKKGFTDTNYTIAKDEELPEDSYYWRVLTNDSYSTNSSAIWEFEINPSQAISVSMSDHLSGGINWTIVSLPIENQSANNNNGTGYTGYDVAVSATGTTADLYIKADDNLTTPGGQIILLSNETFSFNLTNMSVPSYNKFRLTTNFSDNQIGSDLPDGSNVYLKFFLTVPGSQAAGEYSNTVSIKGVPSGEQP